MSEEKKSFFTNLEPRSALLFGVAGGVLVICVIGLIIFALLYFSRIDNSSTASTTANIANSTQLATSNVTKSDKPVVELFAMSYCPYGLQMEIAYLPVMKLLGKKADIKIKFVSYAMHGAKESDENNRQYCIQKEQNDKFLTYMNCFLLNQDYKTCVSTAGVNSTQLSTCITKMEKDYNTIDGYPAYTVDKALNDKYGVEGSPTLVINGVVVTNVNRTPEDVKKAVCSAFTTAPSECNTILDSTGATASGDCGT
jgi:hypothetical protein